MNLSRQIEEYLPRPLLELVNEISREAGRLRQKVYLVGGVVRDLLLGYPNFDLDLVVEGDAVKLAQHVTETGQARLLAHKRFGTAKLRYDDFILDLATARKETYARPGALPTVTPGTLTDDLIRRDFSINAMAVSLATDDYGELVDPHRGKSDLEHRLIRVLHSRSFSDDATRILRGVRYEQRFSFDFEAHTARIWLNFVISSNYDSPKILLRRQEHPGSNRRAFRVNPGSLRAYRQHPRRKKYCSSGNRSLYR